MYLKPYSKQPRFHCALAYASREEMTLQGMMDNVSKVGYGQPWTHIVTVKGGTSVAYTIKIEE